ncbi:hypothetical protein DJ73_13100 [Halorubrum sp. Ea1]|nr:hypothetical protein DJ73_13100 [Halorubrum sp. Ea1]
MTEAKRSPDLFVINACLLIDDLGQRAVDRDRFPVLCLKDGFYSRVIADDLKLVLKIHPWNINYGLTIEMDVVDISKLLAN